MYYMCLSASIMPAKRRHVKFKLMFHVCYYYLVSFYPHVCCCYLLVSLGLLSKCTYRCVYIHLMCTITTLFIYMIVDDKEDAKEEDSSRYGCD